METSAGCGSQQHQLPPERTGVPRPCLSLRFPPVCTRDRRSRATRELDFAEADRRLADVTDRDNLLRTARELELQEEQLLELGLHETN